MTRRQRGPGRLREVVKGCEVLVDHGMGRFYSSHYGCRISFPGRPLRKWLRPTLPDDVVSTTSTEIRYLLDPKSTPVTTKSRDFTLTVMQILHLERRKFGQNCMGTTPSPNQSGNRKPTRSQFHAHKFSLATAKKCKLLRRFYRLSQQRTRQNDKLTSPTTYFPTGKVISRIGKCRRILVTIHATADAMCTTIQCL